MDHLTFQVFLKDMKEKDCADDFTVSKEPQGAKSKFKESKAEIPSIMVLF